MAAAGRHNPFAYKSLEPLKQQEGLMGQKKDIPEAKPRKLADPKAETMDSAGRLCP
jgi:hypothetical protein